jgi:hypothetical protein
MFLGQITGQTGDLTIPLYRFLRSFLTPCSNPINVEHTEGLSVCTDIRTNRGQVLCHY